MFVDVNLETLAIALVLPVGDAVADIVEKRVAAEVEPPDEHATEMADVADIVPRGTKQQWKKKFQSCQQ